MTTMIQQGGDVAPVLSRLLTLQSGHAGRGQGQTGPSTFGRSLGSRSKAAFAGSLCESMGIKGDDRVRDILGVDSSASLDITCEAEVVAERVSCLDATTQEFS